MPEAGKTYCDDPLHAVAERMLRGRGVVAPDGFFLSRMDTVQFSVFNSASSIVVGFRGLILSPTGEVLAFERDITPTTDRAATTEDHQVGEGLLIYLTALLVSGNASRGQTYCRVRILKGKGAGALPFAVLLQGYVSDDYSPSWPHGKQEGPLEGPGVLRSVTGTNPAAGAELSETVPTGARWHLHSLSASLVSDATATTRRVRFLVDDGTTVLGEWSELTGQTASLTGVYTFATQGVNLNYTNNVASVPAPITGQLLAGWRIRTTTLNLAAGDNWGAPQLLVEEWIEA
jgi:hypothetical protein